MEQTGIVIGKESWALLREEPLYSARFIDREETNEIALVARVEAIEEFVEAYPPLTLDVTTWCSSQGIWIVVVSYQFRSHFAAPKGGVFFFNPRQIGDTTLLRKLLQKETLPVVFLSEDCNSHYTVGIVLDPRYLARWRETFNELQQVADGKQLAGDIDPDFEAAVRELEEHRY
jgi:hypothetical protein